MTKNLTDFFFIPGKLSVILDQSHGSSGKGALASYILQNTTKCKFTVNTFMHNASHWVFDDDGRSFCFKNLNSNAHRHEEYEKMYIANGAVLHLQSFLKEIKEAKVPLHKIGISPIAGVTQDIDVEYEKGTQGFDGEPCESHDGTIKFGSTCSGVGATRARKVLRRPNMLLAKDCPELKDMICNVHEEILERLAKGQSGLLEIAQGFSLSWGIPEMFPYTTSRNCTVTGGLDDCMLPVTVVGNVMLNCRTYPIRINSKKYISVQQSVDSIPLSQFSNFIENLKTEGKSQDEAIKLSIEKIQKNYPAEKYVVEFSDGETPCFLVSTRAGVHLTWDQVKSNYLPYEVKESYSGPVYADQEELTWEQVQDDNEITIPQDVILTSLTKLPRRVFTFSPLGLEQAIIYNQTPHKVYISVNFINWIDKEMEGENGDFVSKKTRQWLEKNVLPATRKFKNVEVKILGTGKFTGQRILVSEI
jgi:hypothetical protein